MMMETVPSGTILHGRYRIERVLGSGGFGHVYLAIDLKTSQQFAIKEYFVTGTSGQAQLQHEARVLSQLHHPNLPVFHEAFDERGHYFVVLSYIEGTDLTDHIRMTRTRNEVIPLSQVLEWMLSVCDAVHFLHTQQPIFIHRDIKPDNIRIMPNGVAILVDLGNAKATGDGARTLFFIRHQGTPGYAPQEQYPGGSGTDVRSDVYALGGTLYFALTAQEPPSVSTRNQSIQQGLPDLPSLQDLLAKNPPEESAEAQQGRQFRANVPRPAKPQRHIRHLAQLGTLPPELLQQLSSIIARAMAMRPRDRYQSVAEFGNDLRRVIAALPSIPSIPAVNSSSARPIDPNSTQPDLPLLYDAIQKAKENAARDIPGMPQPPQSPLAVPVEPAAGNVCPRCGTTLLPKASFCPSCGTSVHNSVSQGPVNTIAAAPGLLSSKVTEQHTASSHDMASDKTMVITPPARAQIQTFQPSDRDPHAAAIMPSLSAEHMTLNSKNGQNTPLSIASAVPSTPSNHQPSKGNDFKVDLKIVIMAAILLLLVVLAILLFLAIRHGGLVLNSHPLWLSMEAMEAQVAYYERYISFSITSSAAISLAGLWPCGPGIAAIIGLS